MLILVGGLSGCGGGGGARRDFVLVTVDTLRADRLGAYGWAHPTSPRLDALARRATLFENASATAPATAPSVATILTGLHRAAHGVVRNRGALREGVRTLAERLRQRGYRTVGVVSNPLLFRPGSGFERGFDAYAFPERMARDRGPRRFRGEWLVEEVKRQVAAAGDGPLFLWAHFMDPHGPYNPHPGSREQFPVEAYRRPGDRELPVVEESYGLGVIPGYQRLRTDGPSRVDPAQLRARYDAEVRYVDARVGELLDWLEQRGRFADALFVLTADHGESLGEHDYHFQHGWFAYEDSLRVPLLLRAPGLLPEGRRVEQSVSLVDLAPTVLELLGANGAPAMQGRSLLALIHQGGDDRPAFAQTHYGNRLVSLRLGRLKYIYTPPPPPGADERIPDGWQREWPERAREELYDLAADPGELRDLRGERPEDARRLGELLQAWLASQGEGGEGPPPAPPATPELEAMLEALGYAEPPLD